MVVAIILMAALLLGARPAAALGDNLAECLIALDGDSFRVCGGEERIRAEDYDAPELNGRCDDEIRRAREAHDMAAFLLAQRGAIVLRRLRRDPYDRTIALVLVPAGREWRSIGDILREHGLARRWEGRRRGWC